MPDPLPSWLCSRFRVERKLSEGSFGVVYLATQIGLDRPVAVKVLHAALTSDATVRERFVREARITASLSHPHIVKVIDFGWTDDQPWIAYELLQGRSVGEILEQGQLPVSLAIEAARQVASALEEAHARGILHRDIKPDNVLESGPGHFKVADFGVAHFSGATTCLTGTGAIIGTPAYLAPESIAGAEATERSDLYALGVMLFRMLGGALPFPGRAMYRMWHDEDSVPTPTLRELNPAVTADLERVVLRAMAWKAQDRFSSVRELSEALGAPRSGGRRAASTAIARRGPTVPVTRPPPAGLHRGLAIASIMAAILALVVFAGGSAPRPASPPDRPTASGRPARPMGRPRDLERVSAWLTAMESVWPQVGRTEATIVELLFTDPSRAAALAADYVRALDRHLAQAGSFAGELMAAHDEREVLHPAVGLGLERALAFDLVLRLSLDRVRQQESLGREGGYLLGPELSSIGGSRAKDGQIEYHDRLLPFVARWMRALVPVFEGFAGAPADEARSIGIVFKDVYWVALQFLTFRFPAAAQRELDRDHTTTLEAGLLRLEGATGPLIGRAAAGCWRVGLERNSREGKLRLAGLRRDLKNLEGLLPPTATSLAVLEAYLSEQATRPVPGSGRAATASGQGPAPRAW